MDERKTIADNVCNFIALILFQSKNKKIAAFCTNPYKLVQVETKHFEQ
jgi:hypothetical protein